MTASRLDDVAKQEIVRLSKSLFKRGHSTSSSGNISVAVEDGILITPTNSCRGFLTADRISKVDWSGKHVSRDKPSKEVLLHQAFYDTRAGPLLGRVG